MTAPAELRDRLAAFEATMLPVLSLYLDTSSDGHGRDEFDAFLRKALKDVGTTFPLRSPQRLSVEADRERIAAGFFEAVQVDAPFAEHSLHVAERPHLYPLARLTDQHPPYAAVVADTNAARLFVFGRGVTLRTDAVQGTKVSRSSATEQRVQGAR